ncbi:unnamed protein product [Penicillium salamii]|uniref:Threonylcarbamoyl-AMP synthase n=1 Tax=Penicillium salamii TaxID=1612424 RepID=A0A9W4JEK5_9EURO|nr:unnamed protein product [Penicillium salamii]CAG8122961.1 unnamed protein product [Penicillium salamii]CAG8135948.1 unnamed protein product [Penicillium salamii]CAG8303230.1 unnamed protein product [Penicillium salamii]CAG8331680.1 unnamed protein product [Penicillium salamii]
MCKMLTQKVPDPKSDANKVFQVLKNGGTAIIPMNVGYGIIAIDQHALACIIDAKRREPHKRQAMIGSYSLHCGIHVLPTREAGVVKLLTVDLDLPLGVVAPYCPDHPLIKGMPPDILDKSVMDGTLAMLVNAGELAEEVSRLASMEGKVVMGSSANLTGKGTKIVAEDIEPDILRVADIVVDYGKQKFYYPRASSTMIDFRTIKVLRYGACHDVIQDSLWRFCGIKVPDDPQRPANLSGDTFAKEMQKGYN